MPAAGLTFSTPVSVAGGLVADDGRFELPLPFVGLVLVLHARTEIIINESAIRDGVFTTMMFLVPQLAVKTAIDSEVHHTNLRRRRLLTVTVETSPRMVTACGASFGFPFAGRFALG